MLRSKFVKFVMSILKRQVDYSPNFASFFIIMTHNSSVNFKLILFLIWMKGPIKVPILRRSSALMKIYHIPIAIFQTTSRFLFHILHHSSVSWKITSLYFFRSKIIYFAQYEPMEAHIFETFKCSGQNSPKFCHFWNNRSVFLQILQ